MAKKITLEELAESINNLPFHEFKKLIDQYSAKSGIDFKSEMSLLVTSCLQDRLIKLGINSKCPACDSKNIIKFGKRNHIQLFHCNNCGKRFTLFTDTILEKTRWHWDIWIKVLEMTINNYSVQSMVNVLEADYGCEGINSKTVWLWRLKLIHALASIPQPILTGVIQVDETFVRESQKGSRKLISYLSKEEVRKPRYGRKPSKLGVMGPEFATIVTAIDNRGYCVCKVSSLGRLTDELFVDLFEKHFYKPTFLCSDANKVYENYCTLFQIPHYERPSNYLSVLEDNGYEQPPKDPVKAIPIITNNNIILEKLYSRELIDKITNRGALKYGDFMDIKKRFDLSLARVNELHSEIKNFICGQMTNVSTKYLSDYIGYFTYIRNWRVKNGRYPNSQKDAETIFIDILKTKINYTITNVQKQKLELPKPSKRYLSLLNKETERARQLANNKYFKFNSEDGVKTFNKRNYLYDQPAYKLHKIAKAAKIRHYRQMSKWLLICEIAKQPNIGDILYTLLLEDRHYKMDEEDLQAIKAGKYIK